MSLSVLAEVIRANAEARQAEDDERLAREGHRERPGHPITAWGALDVYDG